jgi:hypothetical protein
MESGDWSLQVVFDLDGPDLIHVHIQRYLVSIDPRQTCSFRSCRDGPPSDRGGLACSDEQMGHYFQSYREALVGSIVDF